MRWWLFLTFLLVTSCRGEPTAVVNETCNRNYNRINAELEATNYCITYKDCTTVKFGCPFGCYYALNKDADVNYFTQQMRLYRQECNTCEYQCAPEARRLQCINHRCTIGFEADIHPKQDKWRVYRDPEDERVLNVPPPPKGTADQPKQKLLQPFTR
ncbi:MAG: hypothetical protein EB060_01440 [Proteobacteria bacterium]|nr:hypothetical protein [Pseudomonadota bacterium]